MSLASNSSSTMHIAFSDAHNAYCHVTSAQCTLPCTLLTTHTACNITTLTMHIALYYAHNARCFVPYSQCTLQSSILIYKLSMYIALYHTYNVHCTVPCSQCTLPCTILTMYITQCQTYLRCTLHCTILTMYIALYNTHNVHCCAPYSQCTAKYSEIGTLVWMRLCTWRSTVCAFGAWYVTKHGMCIWTDVCVQTVQQAKKKELWVTCAKCANFIEFSVQ